MVASASKIIDENSCESKYEPNFKHDPLPEGHVRLLRVQESLNASYSDDEIEISLISASLSACPPYNTLSYTWADPEPFQYPKTVVFTKIAQCYPVKCGGGLILVTRNLRNALRSLQNVPTLATSRTDINKITNMHLYWIDAICINQEDIQERSRQIPLMGRIYGQAQCTIVWLGERDFYTELAMRVLRKIAGDQISSDSLFQLNGDRLLTNTKFEGFHSLSDDETVALGMLLTRKWFSRTWVLQEVVLSPTVMTLWGPVNFSFTLLLKAASVLLESRSSVPFFGRLVALLKEKRWDSSRPDIYREILGAQSALLMIQYGRKCSQKNIKPSFLIVARMCRGSQSSDLRDKIYGVLSIAAELEESGQGDNKPDYNLTVAEVYMRATVVVIRSRSDLACLNLTCDAAYKNIEGLPSWCPDYSTFQVPLIEVYDMERTEQLGLSWSNALSPEIVETSSLRVDGCKFDIVAETSQLMKNGLDGSIPHGLSAVFNLATCLEDEVASTSIARYDQVPFEKLWRTIIYDQYDEHTPAPATVALFIPAFLLYILIMIYDIDGTEPRDTGHVCSIEVLLTKTSLIEEISRLESIKNRLKRQTHYETFGMPNFSRIRKSVIEHPSWKESSSVDDLREILTDISVEELRLSYQEHKAGSSTVGLLSLGTTSSTSSLEELYNLLVQNFGAFLFDGRMPRVYFRTRSTLGVGQTSVRAGDEIWLLYGATAPVILRSLPNGNYRFMGEAYVHGIMYGKAAGRCESHSPIILE